MAAAIDAGALLKELDAQWSQIGKAGQSGVLRASSMTLIVVSGADEDPQALGATLAEIMHDHPNRTIIVRVGGADPLQARTTIQCWMPFGGRQQICCENVEIKAPETALDAVPPVLRGLLVPDLPVVVWLKDPRVAGLRALRPLLGLAGKVIVDTSQCASAAESLQLLAGLQGGAWRVADLAWARITRWREMVAQRLRRGDWPATAERAEITWAGVAMPAPAAYLAAWLAGVFGWPDLSAGRFLLRSSDPGEIPVEEGRIRSLHLRAGSCALGLDRARGLNVGVAVDELRSSAVFPPLSDAMLLGEELAVFGPDPQFSAALARLREVVVL